MIELIIFSTQTSYNRLFSISSGVPFWRLAKDMIFSPRVMAQMSKLQKKEPDCINEAKSGSSARPTLVSTDEAAGTSYRLPSTATSTAAHPSKAQAWLGFLSSRDAHNECLRTKALTAARGNGEIVVSKNTRFLKSGGVRSDESGARWSG